MKQPSFGDYIKQTPADQGGFVQHISNTSNLFLQPSDTVAVHQKEESSETFLFKPCKLESNV
jgi:hypothetical protein